MKLREMELLSTDKSIVKKLENAEKRKALEKCFKKGEMNMMDFLAKETALMLNRLKPKEKKFIPFTRDIRVVDAKFVSNIKQNNPIDKLIKRDVFFFKFT